MPDVKTHCKISFRRTKYDFEDLHKWIDASAKNLGPDHRIHRHAYNIEEAQIIREYWDNREGQGWGDKAVIEWLFHIAIDNLSTAGKFEKSHYKERSFNYLEIGVTDSGEVLVNFEILSNTRLLAEFPE